MAVVLPPWHPEYQRRFMDGIAAIDKRQARLSAISPRCLAVSKELMRRIDEVEGFVAEMRRRRELG